MASLRRVVHNFTEAPIAYSLLGYVGICGVYRSVEMTNRGLMKANSEEDKYIASTFLPAWGFVSGVLCAPAMPIIWYTDMQKEKQKAKQKENNDKRQE